jgi:cob(I)alamin adenosyltransferase
MGNRLSKIYTRTGDEGTTGLIGKTRVAKTHPRIEAIGTVDELNSAIGLMLALGVPEAVAEAFEPIQHRLFNLGGELSMPGETLVEAEHVTELEDTLDALNADLPPLKDFILPGGSPAAGACHNARAVCRRAERRLWALHEQEPINAPALQYVNRLSDLLFVVARILGREAHAAEVTWRHERK